jgi:hypothetical protein
MKKKRPPAAVLFFYERERPRHGEFFGRQPNDGPLSKADRFFPREAELDVFKNSRATTAPVVSEK